MEGVHVVRAPIGPLSRAAELCTRNRIHELDRNCLVETHCYRSIMIYPCQRATSSPITMKVTWLVTRKKIGSP